jgi:hypothetical protein
VVVAWFFSGLVGKVVINPALWIESSQSWAEEQDPTRPSWYPFSAFHASTRSFNDMLWIKPFSSNGFRVNGQL